MNTQADRVMALLKARGLTDREIKPALAKVCGISYQSVREWFTGDTKKIGADHLAKIARHWSGNLAWLVDGTGTMDSPAAKPSYELIPVEVWDDDTPLDDDTVEVPLFTSAEFSSGPGRSQQVIFDEGKRLRYGRMTLKKNGIDPANVAGGLNKGRSNEPVYPDGCIVLMDMSKNEIIDGEPYGLDHLGEFRVKQLYRLPGGGLRLRSYNREEYPDEDYGPDWPEQIRIIGFVWIHQPKARKWRGK